VCRPSSIPPAQCAALLHNTSTHLQLMEGVSHQLSSALLIINTEPVCLQTVEHARQETGALRRLQPPTAGVQLPTHALPQHAPLHPKAAVLETVDATPFLFLLSSLAALLVGNSRTRLEDCCYSSKLSIDLLQSTIVHLLLGAAQLELGGQRG